MQKVTSADDGPTPNDLTGDSVQPNGSASARENGAGTDDAGDGEVSSQPPRFPPLQSFPKEFNKNYLEALDRRYVAILILTLMLEPLLIWYLVRTHSAQLSEQAVAKLQNKYAELFLSDFKVENEQPADPAQTDILAQARKAVPKILEDIDGGFPGEAGGGTKFNLPDLRNRRGASPEARGLSGENREAVRRLNTTTRQRGMQALSKQVERIGLLGVITSGGSGIVSREQVADILQYADSTAGDIDRVIAQVQELRIPRAGIDYFGTSVGGGLGSARGGLGGLPGFDEVYIAPKEVRGKRATSSGVMPEDIVTGLAAAPQKAIERNQQFEQVAPAPALIPMPGVSGLRSRPANGYATREPEKIREVVLAHNPAIQDCYRRQLKGNAALKGKVTVRFTINPAGYVVHVEIVNATMTADGMPIFLPEIEECISTKIGKWRDFGQVDESQGDVTFRQTYNFGY
jgi:hypothetical protein